MKRLTTLVAAGLAAALALTGCGSSSQQTASGPVKLVMWWWGQQEAPGAEAWLKDTVKAYEAAHKNVTIQTVLQTTDGLIPAFQTAAAAKSGPDIQYFWGGIYSQQPGWDGSITPISDLIPAKELSHYLNAKLEESYQGKIWTAPWYVNPSFPVLVRNDVLSQNGLSVPRTWADFLHTCDVLNAKGITTIAGGVKDGWFGGWLYSILGAQSIQSQQDVIAAVVGTQKFTDTKHADWWTRLQETRDHHCWNNDINSLELYQAQQRWVDGKAAMTVTAGSDAPNFAAKVGADKVTVMAMPKWADGPYAGKIGGTSQTVGVTSWSKHQKEAADFIMFMHEPAQLQSWYAKTGALPADDRFDLNSVTDPVRKSLFSMAMDGGPYLENFIPAQLDTDAVFAGVQLVLKGSMTGAQAAAQMQATIEKLRTTDRSLVSNFTAWSK